MPPDRSSDKWGSRTLSYYSFAEYVAPALVLVLLIYLDLLLVVGANLFHILGGVLPATSALVVALMLVGWVMYTSRFYQLLPGYARTKADFRRRLASRLPRFDDLPTEKKEMAGKYIFQEYWRIAPLDWRQESLRLHVNWVFTVHVCNSLMVSAVATVALAVWRLVLATPQPDAPSRLDSVLTAAFLLAGHVPLWVYFRRAAARNLGRSNFRILDNVNRLSLEIEKDLPENLEDYLDAIEEMDSFKARDKVER